MVNNNPCYLIDVIPVAVWTAGGADTRLGACGVSEELSAEAALRE